MSSRAVHVLAWEHANAQLADHRALFPDSTSSPTTQVHIHAHSQIHTHRTYVCTHTCPHRHVETYIHPTLRHTRALMHTDTSTVTHIRTCLRVNTYEHRSMHTHAHRGTHRLGWGWRGYDLTFLLSLYPTLQPALPLLGRAPQPTSTPVTPKEAPVAGMLEQKADKPGQE